MITGFNTDIVFQGVTYHVQTEDKGVNTPLILSLVYDRGTILASKRSPYDDLLKGEFSEKELAERLQRQHKLICAAVRAGRIEDLRQMTLKESAAKQKAPATPQNAKPVIEAQPPIVENVEKKIDEIPIPEILKLNSGSLGESQLPVNFSLTREESLKAKTNGNDVLEIPINVLEDLIVEEVEIIEEEIIVPAEAVEIVAEPEKNEPIDESLQIELLNEVSFKSGERKTLSVLVKRGNGKSGLSGAHVMVKILGTSFRPLIFHAKTDSNGVAIVHLQLPKFSRGRAAVLIRAMSGEEETELRRVIEQD